VSSPPATGCYDASDRLVADVIVRHAGGVTSKAVVKVWGSTARDSDREMELAADMTPVSSVASAIHPSR